MPSPSSPYTRCRAPTTHFWQTNVTSASLQPSLKVVIASINPTLAPFSLSMAVFCFELPNHTTLYLNWQIEYNICNSLSKLRLEPKGFSSK
jgi:hypothetical protein